MTILSEAKNTFETIMSNTDFGAEETFTVQTLSNAYDDAGNPTKTYSGTDTFKGDFQVIDGNTSREESNLKTKSTHKIIAYHDAVTLAIAGNNLIVKTGEEAGNYTVNYVKKFNIYNEIMLVKVVNDKIGTVS